MKLISDIINDLVDTSVPLAGALLKTKLLASRIENHALLKWINGEIDGFSDVDETPSYRMSTGDLVGNVLNGRVQISNYSIPLTHLSKKHYNVVRSVYIHDSIDALEGFARLEKASIQLSVSADIKEALEQSIRRLGNPYFQILSVHKVISASLFKNILSAVRSKLLNFMIALEKEFGEETTIDTLKNNNSIINNFMSTTIYNNGDGNVNNVGDKSTVNAKISIQKLSKDHLREELQKHDVGENDIIDLLNVIDSEEVSEPDHFGQKVGAWIHKMIGKAVDGTWQIGVGAAGGVLTEVINHYYGVK